MSFERLRKLISPNTQISPNVGNAIELPTIVKANPLISVIISCAGNDFQRDRNFNECLKSLSVQSYKKYEVFIIEQSLDGKFYKENVKERFGFNWIGIKDPEDRGFNLSWCRNVGARIANGDKIILMDADMVFESEYLDVVSKDYNVFAGGANPYYWIRNEKVTKEYLNTDNFNSIREYWAREGNRAVSKFSPFDGINGYGAVLVFNKKWFWKSFGGYPEDFFRYGWEDKAAVELIKKILGINNDYEIPRINYEIAHLSHEGKDFNNLKENEMIYKKIKFMSKNEWIDTISKYDLGNINHPTSVLSII